MSKIVLFLLAMAVIPLSSAADSIAGWWLTDDGTSMVSIEPCVETTEKMCGYLVRYESTGDNVLDREVCRLPILGDLSRDGDKLNRGWLLDPDSEEIYNLTVYPKTDGKTIELRVFGKLEMFGESVVWTRAKDGGRDCKIL